MHKIFGESIKKIEELHQIRLNKSRTDFIASAILALVQSRNVQFWEIADKMGGDAETESKHRQIQRFMSEYDLNYEWIAYFIILLLPKQGKLKVCMDRTTWEFGTQNHNILVVTVYTHGVGIPIWFEILDNEGGNSCSEDRMYVMMKLIDVLGKERIGCVIADCEFIGQDWIQWLIKEGFIFCIDVRTNQFLTHKGKKYRISELLGYQQNRSLKNIQIFGITLNIALKKSPKKALAIVSNAPVSDILNIYKLRWSIEVLFANLKTKGFCLENTHLKEPVRLRKLFALVSLAFVVCFIIGLVAHQTKPITVKKHGYRANSIFRNGLNIIRKAMKSNKKIDFDAIVNQVLTIIEKNYLRHVKIVM